MATSALAEGGHDLSTVGMFLGADGVVQAVIILLLLASILSWTTGAAKWIELRRERRQLALAVRRLASATDMAAIGDTGSALLSDMVVQAEDEIAASDRAGTALAAQGVKDRVMIRLDRVEAALRRRAGRGIVILAIIGSTAPFVGLFGTVWGIMNSFIGIAHAHSTNLAVVAPGIAEALLTTAVGLVAAIPAGVLYNLLARMIATLSGEMGDASAAISCLAAREIDRAKVEG
uniref:tonB-system energizer ExbB n=1 Tax=uncultured Sphingomonas sp. TaxID=158754 RepID=UPI0035CA9C57